MNHNQLSYAICHNDAGGWGAITNDVLKFRKVIKFESSRIVLCFCYIYLINDRRRLSIKRVVKNL